jgi:thymidylate synthase (FAD)
MMDTMTTNNKNFEKINVLDNGFVQYVSHMGDDLTVVNAARVSFNKESEEFGERDEKLIQYLAKHKHWTPFAHPQITLRIKAPIFVRTQLFKHKVGFTENEISRRYVTFEPEIYNPNWRSAPINGAKQGSADFITDEALNNRLDFLYGIVTENVKVYEELLKLGVAPEQARSVLPQGTYTEWWWTGSLSAYARMYSQRIDTHAQWEIQQYAKGVGEIIEKLYPISWRVLTSND